MRKNATPPHLEPCNVCHSPVDVSKPCFWKRARCLDCAWESNAVYVFCSRECAQVWTPPELPPHGHRAGRG
jgi:hypothetical protein